MWRVPGAPGRRSRPLQTEPARTQSPVMTLVSHKSIDVFDLSSAVWRSQHSLCMFLLLCREHQHGTVQQQKTSIELFQYGMVSWQQYRALVDTPTDCQPSPIFCPSHCAVNMLQASHCGFYPTWYHTWCNLYYTQVTSYCLLGSTFHKTL